MSELEVRYRRLLRAYPPAYRRAHAEEILGTLMEASRGRERPSLRETAGLIGGGLTARLRGGAEHPVSWWADGLHLGVFLIALTNLIMDVGFVYPDPWNRFTGWVIGSAVLVLALARGWIRLALPLALVAAFQVSRPLVFGEHLLRAIPIFGPMYGDWGSVPQYVVMATGLMVLAIRPSRGLRARSWLWLAVPPLAFAVMQLHIPVGSHAETQCLGVNACRVVRFADYFPLYRAVRAAAVVVLLSAGIWATAVVRDLRWLLASAIFVLVTVGVPLLISPGPSANPTGLAAAVWALQVALLLAMAGTAYRARHVRA